MSATDDRTFDDVRGRFDHWDREIRPSVLPPDEQRQAAQAYARAMIDDWNHCVPGTGYAPYYAYVDRLAEQLWRDTPADRAALAAAVHAFTDGWDDGHRIGYDAGIDDGRMVSGRD